MRWTSARCARRASSTARTFVGIASAGFDSDANRIANEAPAWLGGLVYAYGALRALVSWKPARFEIELDPPGEKRSFTAYTIGTCNSKAYGGGMLAAPDAMLDDGLLEVIVLESIGKLAFLTKILPNVFKGTHVDEPSVHVFRAREVVDHLRPAVHDVRRRRPDRRAARQRARGARARSTCWCPSATRRARLSPAPSPGSGSPRHAAAPAAEAGGQQPPAG